MLSVAELQVSGSDVVLEELLTFNVDASALPLQCIANVS